MNGGESGNEKKKETLKALSHDPFLRIRFLLVPKNGSCEHVKNDLPSNGSVILKKTWNLEIGPSERLLPVFGTKNQIIKNGWCERALS